VCVLEGGKEQSDLDELLKYVVKTAWKEGLHPARGAHCTEVKESPSPLRRVWELREKGTLPSPPLL